MPFGYGLWVFLKNNPVVAYAAAGVAALATFLSWQRLRDMRIRREVTEKIEVRAQETATKVIEDAQEKTNDVIEKVDQARAAVSGGTPSGELPKSTQSTLFRD